MIPHWHILEGGGGRSHKRKQKACEQIFFAEHIKALMDNRICTNRLVCKIIDKDHGTEVGKTMWT